MDQDNKIVLFQEPTHIRKIWHKEQMFFSVIDVIDILTETKQAQTYWGMLKKRENQLITNCEKLKFLAPDGKMRSTDCANTEGILRIIMSIPSPKAEPLKLWLAEQGKRAIDEINDPEIAMGRLKDYYIAKGYSNEWIETRLKTIDIRKQLTDEWKGRGVKEGQEYSILTAEIAKATFGLTPSDHKKFKGLETQNLRDHMSNLELIFTMLGEETTRRVVLKDDALGFEENHEAAQKGGYATGEALKRYEQASGELVVSPDNFLNQIEEAQKKNIEKLPPQ
jgi:DNA-damage-inducible protein D